MGFHSALNACFSLHELNHAHWAWATNGEAILGTPEHVVPSWRDARPVRPRDKHEVGG